MRSISVAGLAKIAQTHGTEPVTLVEVDWAEGITPKWYGDKEVSIDIPGKIIELSGLDNVVGISSNITSQAIDVILSDTDGSLKTILDRHDIHRRTARVYQWFEGAALSDKFLLFSGKISTPITWSEHDRTVKFTILSQIEDKEVGFSPEEGQFEWLPSDMVGVTWPMIFGTVKDCPALRINDAVSGTTLQGVGAIAGQDLADRLPLFEDGANMDSSAGVALAQLSAQAGVVSCALACHGNYADINERTTSDLMNQLNALYAQMAQVASSATNTATCAQQQRNQQKASVEHTGLGANPLKILGGEDFPQHRTLTLEIEGCQFTGHFDGMWFYISSRYWPDGEATALTQYNSKQESCDTGAMTAPVEYDYRIPVACNCMWAEAGCVCRDHGMIFSSSSGRSTGISPSAVLQQFWAEPGAAVTIKSGEPITYIVSTIPGTVLAVKAYKQFTGERRLVDVPASYYTVQNVTYGAIYTKQVVTHRPLSSYADQGWSDDLYVSYESSVGPNTVDILIYLIQNYSDLTYDTVSFASVRTKLIPFPANFPILDRKNVVELLQEIAYQARCALWLSNGKCYLSYLPEEPTSVATITESDIDAERGIETELTTTEDLVTKMKITWRMSWAPGRTDRDKDKSEKTIILRHNIKRYGTKVEEKSFYVYNQPDIVYKVATFWLIRKSTTWKRVRFSTFLNLLNLEPFDCVTLDFDQTFISVGPIKALVEEARYNSDTQQIDFQCLVPIQSGQMTKYVWFWPAAVPAWQTWPPADEIDAGFAGGDGIGMYASGTLPVGSFSSDNAGTIIVGGPNVVFRRNSDWGDHTPTDVGFAPQPIGIIANYAEAEHSVKPSLQLELILAKQRPPYQVTGLPAPITLDLATTVIVDSKGEGGASRHTNLKSFFYGITADNKLAMSNDNALIADTAYPEGYHLSDVFTLGSENLCVSTTTTFSDGDNEKEFDFQYDDEGNKFGAGTAFLQSE